MVGGESAWTAFSFFCEQIMQKEEAERERERAPRNSGRPPPPAGDEEDGREEGNRRRVDRRGPRKDRP